MSDLWNAFLLGISVSTVDCVVSDLWNALPPRYKCEHCGLSSV